MHVVRLCWRSLNERFLVPEASLRDGLGSLVAFRSAAANSSTILLSSGITLRTFHFGSLGRPLPGSQPCANFFSQLKQFQRALKGGFLRKFVLLPLEPCQCDLSSWPLCILYGSKSRKHPRHVKPRARLRNQHRLRQGLLLSFVPPRSFRE